MVVVVVVSPAVSACVSQGGICSDNRTCCHTEIEATDRTISPSHSILTALILLHQASGRVPQDYQCSSHWYDLIQKKIHGEGGRIFPIEGIIPLKLTWILTPNPPKTLLGESINGGLVCAHMHSIPWTQKILTFMS